MGWKQTGSGGVEEAMAGGANSVEVDSATRRKDKLSLQGEECLVAAAATLQALQATLLRWQRARARALLRLSASAPPSPPPPHPYPHTQSKEEWSLLSLASHEEEPNYPKGNEEKRALITLLRDRFTPLSRFPVSIFLTKVGCAMGNRSARLALCTRKRSSAPGECSQHCEDALCTRRMRSPCFCEHSSGICDRTPFILLHLAKGAQDQPSGACVRTPPPPPLPTPHMKGAVAAADAGSGGGGGGGGARPSSPIPPTSPPHHGTHQQAGSVRDAAQWSRVVVEALEERRSMAGAAVATERVFLVSYLPSPAGNEAGSGKKWQRRGRAARRQRHRWWREGERSGEAAAAAAAAVAVLQGAPLPPTPTASPQELPFFFHPSYPPRAMASREQKGAAALMRSLGDGCPPIARALAAGCARTRSQGDFARADDATQLYPKGRSTEVRRVGRRCAMPALEVLWTRRWRRRPKADRYSPWRWHVGAVLGGAGPWTAERVARLGGAGTRSSSSSHVPAPSRSPVTVLDEDSEDALSEVRGQEQERGLSAQAARRLLRLPPRPHPPPPPPPPPPAADMTLGNRVRARLRHYLRTRCAHNSYSGAAGESSSGGDGDAAVATEATGAAWLHLLLPQGRAPLPPSPPPAPLAHDPFAQNPCAPGPLRCARFLVRRASPSPPSPAAPAATMEAVHQRSSPATPASVLQVSDTIRIVKRCGGAGGGGSGAAGLLASGEPAAGAVVYFSDTIRVVRRHSHPLPTSQPWPCAVRVAPLARNPPCARAFRHLRPLALRPPPQQQTDAAALSHKAGSC